MDNGDKENIGQLAKPERPNPYVLTKRERFAMAAMQGDWASQSAEVGEFPNDMAEELLDERSKMYVRAANSLLKALEGE